MAFLFIFPVTTVMGLSFPLLTEVFHRNYGVEKMYGMNTIGGGLGILLLGFFSIKYLGYQNTFWLTALGNFLLFGWIFLLREKFISPHQSEFPKENDQHFPIGLRLGTVAFLSGFILLGLEVVWFKTLEIIINDRAYISTLLLFIVLLALGLTAWFSPRLFKRSLAPLYALITASICFFFAGEFLSEEAFKVARGYPRVSLVKSLYVSMVFLCPLFLLGFTFPSLLNFKDWRGMETAKLLLLNTFGGMVGTLLVSYTIIDHYGMKSFYVFAMFSLIALMALLPQGKIKFPTIGFSLILSLFFVSFFQADIFIHKKEKTLVTKETPHGLFSLIERNKHLEIYSGNYRIVSPYGTQNVTHAQNALAYFPALFVKNPKTILSMGTGYGISLGAFLTLDPQKIVSVEILKSVNDVSHYFKAENKEWYKDERVRKVVDDARGFLRRNPNTYDMISSNIASPYTTSGSLFLTEEYFQDVLDHLNDDGVYSQLVWGPHLPEILHTFKKVFPHMTAIPGYANTDLVLVGSKKPLERKKDLHVFDDKWPLYQGKYTREETLKIGQEILMENLEKKPEFIISDHFASLTHNWDRGLRFFWIHGH